METHFYGVRSGKKSILRLRRLGNTSSLRKLFFVSSGLPFVDCATYLGRYLMYGDIYCTDFTCISYTFPFLLGTLLLCYPVTLLPVILLPCYSVTLLPCYSVTILLCYLVILLPCHSVILLLCYLVCYSFTLLLCYLVTLLLCYSVTLLPCYPVTLLLCYLVTLLPCYSFLSRVFKDISFCNCRSYPS